MSIFRNQNVDVDDQDDDDDEELQQEKLHEIQANFRKQCEHLFGL